MKEIYSFAVTRKKEKIVPSISVGGDGKSVETTTKTVEEITHRVVFAKPSMSMIEEAEFFYGQKFNEFINSGFLTKAMLSKKMGDLGGLSSKITMESLQKSILDNLESSRVIEFYGGSGTLSDEQKQKLEGAKQMYTSTKTQVIEYEQAIRSQFSQTADVKAEQRLIEWLVFHLSFFEEDVDSKKEMFPLFEGDTYEEKRAQYLELCESLEDITNAALFKPKAIFDEAFQTLVRVASIWYNKIAEKQDDIKAALADMFSLEQETAPEPSKASPPPTEAEPKENVSESLPEPAVEPEVSLNPPVSPDGENK